MRKIQAWQREEHPAAAAISPHSAALIKSGIVSHQRAINSWEAHSCVCVTLQIHFAFSLHSTACVSQEQYVFIHDAILEACLCGETAIPVNEFALTYKEMLKVDSQSNTSPLREEFQVSLEMCDLSNSAVCQHEMCLAEPSVFSANFLLGHSAQLESWRQRISNNQEKCIKSILVINYHFSGL